jgi:hypothetical protein
MSWPTFLLVLLIELPSLLGGVSAFRTGWTLPGATYIAVSIAWAVASAWAVELSRSMQPGARRVFTRALLVTLAPIGAVLGQMCGFFSTLAANYGANQVSLAVGFVQFFVLGVAVAVILGALIGGVIVLIAKAAGAPATSNSQES